MKLYYANATCSMAIHLLMEEIGVPYEKQRLGFAEQDQRQPAYLAVNPKGKVPALATDGDGVITELPVIAFYLGRAFPDAGLLPDDLPGQVRALELMDYIAATVHMRGFSRLANPRNFSADGDPELVRQTGLAVIQDGLRVLEGALGSQDYFQGRFGVADAAAFIIEFWSEKRGIPLPDNLQRHYERMRARPAVQRMLRAEGAIAA